MDEKSSRLAASVVTLGIECCGIECVEIRSLTTNRSTIIANIPSLIEYPVSPEIALFNSF